LSEVKPTDRNLRINVIDHLDNSDSIVHSGKSIPDDVNGTDSAEVLEHSAKVFACHRR